MQGRERPLLVRTVKHKVRSSAAVLEDRVLTGNPVAHKRRRNAKSLRPAHRRGGGIGKRIVAAIGILREIISPVALDVDLLQLFQPQYVAARLQPGGYGRIWVVGRAGWRELGYCVISQRSEERRVGKECRSR